MPARLRIALTADLHWGSHDNGDEATRGLVAFLKEHPPDGLVLAGDQGASGHFGECLALFDDLLAWKALVPGNHDIWVNADDPRGDSLRVYRDYLPARCAEHGFRYLDHGPLILPDSDLALVGSINWYDYSWSIQRLREEVPNWEFRVRSKVFSRGMHNDARFIRWPLDDGGFTAEVTAALDQHLQTALAQVSRALVVTHHPPFFDLCYPRSEPASMDRLLWDAFSGNRRLEEVLIQYAGKIPFAFCGHTHRERESEWQGIRGHNIGSDYHFKRLLLLDWPSGTVEAHIFGNPAIR